MVLQLNHQFLLEILNIPKLGQNFVGRWHFLLRIELRDSIHNPMLKSTVTEIVFKNGEILSFIPRFHKHKAREHLYTILVGYITKLDSIDLDKLYFGALKLFHQLIPIGLKVVAWVAALHVEIDYQVLIRFQQSIEILNAIDGGAKGVEPPALGRLGQYQV